ncbi:hypothetical protein N7444_009872 [Penicillium canescens]|nr:hypothetical protein N7444_009872 [Penicillium canescens]
MVVILPYNLGNYRHIYLNHAAEQGRSLVTGESRNAAAANGLDPRASGKLSPWAFVMALVPMPNMNSRMISLGYLSATVRASQFASRDPLKHVTIPI